VQEAVDELEPLALAGVSITPAASEALAAAWAAVHQRKHALCTSPQHLVELVQQVRRVRCCKACGLRALRQRAGAVCSSASP
jgi:hypothetical protein